MGQSLIRALLESGVEFVLVGGTAAVLHGAPIVTHDIDIVHRQTAENVARLVNVLDTHRAVVRDDARRLRVANDVFFGRGHILLSTDLGPIDVLCRLGPDQDYEWLLPRSEELAFGDRTVRVIDLPTLIQVKGETGRAKDRLVLPILAATLDERAKRKVEH